MCEPSLFFSSLTLSQCVKLDKLHSTKQRPKRLQLSIHWHDHEWVSFVNSNKLLIYSSYSQRHTNHQTRLSWRPFANSSPLVKEFRGEVSFYVWFEPINVKQPDALTWLEKMSNWVWTWNIFYFRNTRALEPSVYLCGNVKIRKYYLQSWKNWLNQTTKIKIGDLIRHSEFSGT